MQISGAGGIEGAGGVWGASGPVPPTPAFWEDLQHLNRTLEACRRGNNAFYPNEGQLAGFRNEAQNFYEKYKNNLNKWEQSSFEDMFHPTTVMDPSRIIGFSADIDTLQDSWKNGQHIGVPKSMLLSSLGYEKYAKEYMEEYRGRQDIHPQDMKFVINNLLTTMKGMRDGIEGLADLQNYRHLLPAVIDCIKVCERLDEDFKKDPNKALDNFINSPINQEYIGQIQFLKDKILE